MSDIENEMIPVEIVLREGLCTPNCLLALESDDKNKCSCRCGGKYHGSLACSYVIPGLSNNWWETEEAVYLDHDEYVDAYGKGMNEFNRIYRISHGRFNAVIRDGRQTYSVRFDYESFHPSGSVQDFNNLERLMNALMISRRITSYSLDKSCLDRPDYSDVPGEICEWNGRKFKMVRIIDIPMRPDLDPSVDFAVYGIGNLDEAKVIHNALLNFCYTPYALNTENQIDRVRKYALTHLNIDINDDCTCGTVLTRKGNL